MARPVWQGAISFGLVNVGVGLYSATEEQSMSFHLFEQGTGKRVRNKRVWPKAPIVTSTMTTS